MVFLILEWSIQNSVCCNFISGPSKYVALIAQKLLLLTLILNLYLKRSEKLYPKQAEKWPVAVNKQVIAFNKVC